MWDDSFLNNQKLNLFLTFLTRVIGQKIICPGYADRHLHNQFYQMKMQLPIIAHAHPESLVKVKLFQCKHLLLTAVRHMYSYIGLQIRCIMGYAQMVNFIR